MDLLHFHRRPRTAVTIVLLAFTTSVAPAGYNVDYGTVVANAITLSPSPVPEPAFVLAACGGLAGLAAWRRRARCKPSPEVL